MSSHRTKLLGLLLLAAGMLAAWGWSWQSRQRAAAEGSAADLAACKVALADLEHLGAAPASVAVAGGSDGDLNQPLRAAAVAAGIPDELASIDPGQPRQLPQADYSQTLVFLRLNSVTLCQLVTFLHTLSAQNASVRTKSIELAPAGEAASSVGSKEKEMVENWAADVTLACLNYSPRPRAGQ
jgi:hypothetical protein